MRWLVDSGSSRNGSISSPPSDVAEPGEERAEIALRAQDVCVHLRTLGDHGVHRASGEGDVGTQCAVRPGPQRAVEDHLIGAVRGEHDVRQVLFDEVGLDQFPGRHTAAERIAERGLHVDRRAALLLAEIG